MQVWVLLVTDGESIEFSPEIYTEAEQARQEAEHWAWVLSSAGVFAVRRPFDGRWEVGVRDIRLVKEAVEQFDDRRDWWVGVHWTSYGFPDPECVLLEGRSSALEWVTTPAVGGVPASTIYEDVWLLSATFDNDEAKSVALPAKVVSARWRTSQRVVQYEVELVGTFVQSIHGTVRGRPGLTREGIEEIVEREWSALSVGTDVLLESSWELEGFREVPS